MLIAIVAMIAWLMLGLYGIYFDKHSSSVNVPFILFMSLFPFFPFIFHWCGL